jgi:hypothetical protein
MSRIEGKRLDVALEELGSPTQERRVEVDQDEGVGPLPDRSAGAFAPHSLREEIVDFVIPRITEPAILRYDHSVPLLEYLISDLLPQLEEGSELHTLATTFLSDEIVRHRNLVAQIYQGLAA